MTIEEIQKQITELQKIVESMQKQKMEISRHFTGDYIKLYKGKQYRRMESENIPIWEYFSEEDSRWIIESEVESEKLEEVYCNDCVHSKLKT